MEGFGELGQVKHLALVQLQEVFSKWGQQLPP